MTSGRGQICAVIAIAAGLAGLALAAAALAGYLLAAAPGAAVHAYRGYFNSVSQEFQQAQGGNP